jgi:hypothetical protein
MSIAAQLARVQARLERLEGGRQAPAFLDPVELAEAVGIRPDLWQTQVLRSTSSRLILNCARQSGKSTVVALLVLHTALFQPGSLVLLLSPGERQSGEIFRKVMDAYRRIGRPVKALRENLLELELANGSRIIALPGQEHTVRGYSGAALLVVDEAARTADDLYRSVRPMLGVSHGRLALLSTPWGKRGFFYEEWQRRDRWDAYEIPASMCPRISADFLDEEQATLGPWWYRQEYECEFSDVTDQLFGLDLVRAAISDEVVPLFRGGIDGTAAPSSVA